MANKSIKELPKATQIQEDDALPMQQGSTTKQVTGLTLTMWLLAIADGHGGVTDFQKLSESGLEKTYQFTMADTTKYPFTVTDGNGVADFQHSVSDLVHTYKLIMDNGQEYTMTIKDGDKGDKGDNAYVWFRFASEKPTSSSSSMGEEADDWIGFYSGNKPTAPTDPMEYVWAPFRGRQGLTGDPATLIRAVVEYQVSTSATVEPSGNWSESIPVVPQGSYLWSRTTIQFNTGGIIRILNKSRDGLDGLGSVVSVNNISPGENGNVELTADDVRAVPKSGGTMTGPINMNGQPITGLNPPTEGAQAANKGYVDGSVRKAAPRNLLDNSDFRNPVNQRRQTSYNSGEYSLDRWVVVSDEFKGTISLVTDANGTTVTVLNGNRAAFLQRFVDANYYPGKYTAVMKLSDGTIAEGYVEAVSEDNHVYAFICWVPSGATAVWAALYEGEYTAETLPEYRPKGYAAELAECLRYYYNVGATICPGYLTSAGKNYTMFVSLPVPMRVKPSVVGSPAWLARTSTGYANKHGNTTAPFENILIAGPYPVDVSRLNIVDSVTEVVDENNTVMTFSIYGLALSADL